VQEFGDVLITTDGGRLWCRACDSELKSEKRFNVRRHVVSEKHRRHVASRVRATGQLPPSADEYASDLCYALLASDIPFHKTKHPVFRNFLLKYTSREMPAMSRLRVHVDNHYADVMAKVRRELQDHYVWIAMDETTDAMGRYVLNTVVGRLSADSKGKSFLLNSDVLDKTNATTVAQAFLRALHLLWPDEVQYDKVALLLTDAASYMHKAASTLSALCPNLIHQTCVVHGLHRVAEEIRGLFPTVDALIASGKKVRMYSSPLSTAHLVQLNETVNRSHVLVFADLREGLRSRAVVPGEAA